MEKQNNQSIKAFSLASLFNDIGSDMIAPIWPLFLTTILGANVALLGLIEGIAIAVVAISKMIAGWWSDYIGKRKPFVTYGYLLSSISRIGYYLATNPLMIIPFKILDRFGKIRGAPRNAMIAEITKKSNRGRAFGLLRSMDSLGAVIGTIITLVIINLMPIRDIMLLAVIPSLISSIIILLFVKETKGKKLFKGFSFKMPLKLKKLTILMTFFSLFSFTYSFIILLAKDKGFSNFETIILYLIMNITYSSTAYYFGKLSDKIGRFKLMILGLTLFAITCLTAINSLIIITFILFGLHLAVFDPVQKTIISELAPKERKGGIIGTYEMIIGLTAIPGGLFMGWLYDLNNLYPFITGLISSLIITLIIKETYKRTL